MKKNIFLQNSTKEIEYKSYGGPHDDKLPVVDRKIHIKNLMAQYNSSLKYIDTMKSKGEEKTTGYYIDFSSQEKCELVSKSLEDLRMGIKLLNVVKNEADVTKATVFIPNEKEHVFNKKFYDFSQTIELQVPKNDKLIRSINFIEPSKLESFWTSKKEFLPHKENVWCEIWLRFDDKNPKEEVMTSTKLILNMLSIQFKEELIEFPERLVLLICANRTKLDDFIKNCSYIAEIQKATEPNLFFIKLMPRDRNQFIEDLLKRTHRDFSKNICVTLLDTGINTRHSLLENNIQSVQKVVDGNIEDINGHGSEMAGIILYNDLEPLLEQNDNYKITSKIESVKILPDSDINEAQLYGEKTIQAVSLAEIDNPNAKRIICMAVTAKDEQIISGNPTSWSAAVDKIVFNSSDENNKRIFFVSAGNVLEEEIRQLSYPEANILHSIENPAQAWNAITVGAYAGKDIVNDPNLSNFHATVDKGNLSPFSSSSMIWDKTWPIKPEVLFDGGNMCTNGIDFDHCENLGLLTTSNRVSEITTIWGTSSAVAQAANFASNILSVYPDMWSETVRALFIHSAEWTESMKSTFLKTDTKADRTKLLRTCGYGIPNLQKALECMNNSVNMIVQDEMIPFRKDGFKEMKLISLPFPKQELENLGTTPVKLKVTLSYYIEPSPGNIECKNRYTYSSFGLHFDIKNPLEDDDDFIRRIDYAKREDSYTQTTHSLSNEWYLGPNNRNKGSIHSDFIETTANRLSEMDKIAVFPITGWWRTRSNLVKYNNKLRYSLVVTISTPSNEIDLYTPIMAKIGNIVEVKV